MGVALQENTLAAFLEWENTQPERHEFNRGEVFARVGGKRSHGRVVLNLARRLAEQLDGSPCQVFVESMKVQVADDTILYPDVFVTCDKADLATEMIFRAPTLVIEVLSPTTQAYDRSQKFALYWRLASLREYILVDPDTRQIESLRRADDGSWVFHDMSHEDAMLAPSVGCAVPIAQMFDGVDPQA